MAVNSRFKCKSIILLHFLVSQRRADEAAKGRPELRSGGHSDPLGGRWSAEFLACVSPTFAHFASGGTAVDQTSVGRLAAAEEVSHAALKLKPDDAEAHGNLDRLLEAKAERPSNRISSRQPSPKS